jgi:predicted signal transduction protein with EAL and GGDEF domain
MTLPSNLILILSLILLIIVIVYFLLPKLNLGKYGNAYLKTAIAWVAIGYIAFDMYKQDKITIVIMLVLGAMVFGYTAFTAKEKK